MKHTVLEWYSSDVGQAYFQAQESYINVLTLFKTERTFHFTSEEVGQQYRRRRFLA